MVAPGHEYNNINTAVAWVTINFTGGARYGNIIVLYIFWQTLLKRN